MENLILLSEQEAAQRIARVRDAMANTAIECVLISTFANIFYLTGRVFRGWIAIPAKGDPTYFVKSPSSGLRDARLVHIRKPEDMAAHISLPRATGMETDSVAYGSVMRLCKAFGIAAPMNASAVMNSARAVKTPAEIDKLRRSGVLQTSVYRQIPQLYQPGMSDLDLQIAIETLSRTHGCLGQFRVGGDSMEIFMGNVLTGKNADHPGPYDFAMGGAGTNPSLPVGADGTIIEHGLPVMVDVNGNFTGYMTDMTRVFACGNVSQEVMRAHDCSIEICHAFQEKAREGVAAADLWQMAADIADRAGLRHLFMGHRQQAGFVGHGVGIEINELPVIAPRSKAILQSGNVVALEPKFVIPDVGAVGIENTYVIGNGSAECLTTAPEEIVSL